MPVNAGEFNCAVRLRAVIVLSLRGFDISLVSSTFERPTFALASPWTKPVNAAFDMRTLLSLKIVRFPPLSMRLALPRLKVVSARRLKGPIKLAPDRLALRFKLAS